MAEPLFEVERAAGANGAPLALVLRCHVQPGAGRAAVAGRRGDALHVRVAPPPVDGRANAALLALIASLFDRPRAAVSLVGGERSRLKRVRIEGVAPEEAGRVLDEAIAASGERAGRSARRAGPAR